jgi:hypothetical protein
MDKNSVVVSIPTIFVLVGGLMRFWILSKRNYLPQAMTKNWLYNVKMVK